MNEKVKELIKKAGTDVSGKWMSHDHAQKFAEFIVRECALICESRPGPGDDVRSRQHCSLQILEHFGVEE